MHAYRSSRDGVPRRRFCQSFGFPCRACLRLIPPMRYWCSSAGVQELPTQEELFTFWKAIAPCPQVCKIKRKLCSHSWVTRQPGVTQAKPELFKSSDWRRRTARLHIKCYLFVHFYSGFRRAGDLQHCIEAQQTFEGATLYCLSVDLCLMKQRSDLTDPATCQFWKDQIHSGQVLGCGGGPSCETWSAARHTPGGPRPVRSFDHPWGKPGLTKAESHQVSVGTALVQFFTWTFDPCGCSRALRLSGASGICYVVGSKQTRICLDPTSIPVHGETTVQHHPHLRPMHFRPSCTKTDNSVACPTPRFCQHCARSWSTWSVFSCRRAQAPAWSHSRRTFSDGEGEDLPAANE